MDRELTAATWQRDTTRHRHMLSGRLRLARPLVRPAARGLCSKDFDEELGLRRSAMSKALRQQPKPQPRQQQQQSQFSLTQDLPLNLLLPSKGLQYQMPTVPDASIIPQPAQIINLVDPQQQEKLKEILLIQNIELLRLQQELMQHHTLKQGQSIQLQNLNASER